MSEIVLGEDTHWGVKEDLPDDWNLNYGEDATFDDFLADAASLEPGEEAEGIIQYQEEEFLVRVYNVRSVGLLGSKKMAHFQVSMADGGSQTKTMRLIPEATAVASTVLSMMDSRIEEDTDKSPGSGFLTVLATSFKENVPGM
jgi:hypothetical protein